MSAVPPNTQSEHRRPAVGLDLLLALHPGVTFVTWMASPSLAMIDLLRIPDGSRRRGLGTMVYRMWEDTLADGVTVELFAVDRTARAFWSSLGFEDIGDGGMARRVDRHASPADISVTAPLLHGATPS